jgi:hypothetical protein
VATTQTFSMRERSYWMLGAYAPALSEKRNAFLRLLKHKGFKEESMTKVGVYAIGTSTTLESNKSPGGSWHLPRGGKRYSAGYNSYAYSGPRRAWPSFRLKSTLDCIADQL